MLAPRVVRVLPEQKHGESGQTITSTEFAAHLRRECEVCGSTLDLHFIGCTPFQSHFLRIALAGLRQVETRCNFRGIWLHFVTCVEN